MAESKQDRLQVGFKRLGIAVGTTSMPVVWVAIYIIDPVQMIFEHMMTLTLIAVFAGLILMLVIWFIPIRIVRVATWVIDGFTSAGSKGKSSQAPKEEER